MIDKLKILSAKLTENEARIRLAVGGCSGIASLSGSLRGPYCETARTLAAEFPLVLHSISGDSHRVLETIVVDPCYWTPQMPFQYKTSIQLQPTAGTVDAIDFLWGLKRWSRDQSNLRLNLRRIVLRGLRLPHPTTDDLAEAHRLETALVISVPADEVCLQASRIGVALVVDLTTLSDDLLTVLHWLDWFPAVMVAVLTSEQLRVVGDSTTSPNQFLLAQRLDGHSESSDVHPAAKLLAVELAAGVRLPHWLAGISTPVIAIRSADSPALLSEARQECDRLQAELAPEFSLAGYFV